jgi:hypothetical protein
VSCRPAHSRSANRRVRPNRAHIGIDARGTVAEPLRALRRFLQLWLRQLSGGAASVLNQDLLELVNGLLDEAAASEQPTGADLDAIQVMR